MRVLSTLLLLTPIALACTRSVDDQTTYGRCFVDRECDPETNDGCFALLGETASLSICSRYCEMGCPGGGTCTDRYEVEEDGGAATPICAQACVNDAECPGGGFVCTGGSCVPP